MKIKLSIMLATVITSLSATQAFINPLPNNMKATDNGGTKSAIDAYKDGVGVMVVDNLMTTNNLAMNTLVYKYGEEAKANNTTIVDQVAYGTTNPPAADLKLVGTLTVNGTTCTHSDVKVVNETWLNGVCTGTLTVNGTTCTHADVKVVNETWTDGVCNGTLTVNGTACNDGNSATTGETWLNGVCQGGSTENIAGNGLVYDNCEGGARNWTDANNYCLSKGDGWRLPNLGETNLAGTSKITSGINGVPQCTATIYSWTASAYGGTTTVKYVWSANSTVNAYGITSFYSVRCVK